MLYKVKTADSGLRPASFGEHPFSCSKIPDQNLVENIKSYRTAVEFLPVSTKGPQLVRCYTSLYELLLASKCIGVSSLKTNAPTKQAIKPKKELNIKNIKY